MKAPRFFLTLSVLSLFLLPSREVQAYNIYYAEQYYKLYHQNFYQYPEDFEENIWYLERALKNPFANPLNAMAKIRDKKEWERYRMLFYLHVNLEMVKQYRLWAAEYDKRFAYFYNQPWKDQNLESLEIAEHYYKTAFYYWDQALLWWARLEQTEYLHLEEVHYWEDERARIGSGDLDYGDILEEDLARLRQVRAAFETMDDTTY
jgi:hypothetical protein